MNDTFNTPKPFDVAKRTMLIRQFEQTLKEMKEEFTEKCKPYIEAAETLRNEIMGFLNDTGQENARTLYGTPYKYKDVRWRIQDVDQFKRHVIGSEDWDLLTWHVSKTVADTRFDADQSLPPGTVRDATIKLGIKAPVKPRKRTPKDPPVGTITDEQWAQIEAEVDQELAIQDTLESEKGEE